MVGKDPFQGLIPRGDAILGFVLPQAIEDVAAQTEPGAVGIVSVHHLLPHGDRQHKPGFPIPWDGSDLHGLTVTLVKDRAAKQKTKRNSTLGEAAEILRGSDVEIERTGYR